MSTEEMLDEIKDALVTYLSIANTRSENEQANNALKALESLRENIRKGTSSARGEK